ncbi:MAG: GIY-YIG nuclease family protein [Nitrosopumilus sp.]|nr:GIY-YIG nuclease family protein [Nitrosopumilus sp.]
MVHWSRIQKIIEKSRSHKISHIVNNNNFDFAGVYLIYDPKMNLQYIGHTNSIKKRCEEHMLNIGTGNLCSKIKRRPTASQKIESYRVKYITIEDNYRERCFTECQLLAVYRPPLNFIR